MFGNEKKISDKLLLGFIKYSDEVKVDKHFTIRFMVRNSELLPIQMDLLEIIEAIDVVETDQEAVKCRIRVLYKHRQNEKKV